MLLALGLSLVLCIAHLRDAIGASSNALESRQLPMYPLIAQGPLVSAWAPRNELNAADTEHWGGFTRTFTGAIKVDGVPFAWMGNPNRMGAKYTLATQVALPFVTSTRTLYQFEAGAAVAFNITFCTPALLSDFDLLSPGVTYITVDVASIDGTAHQVAVLFAGTGELAGGTQNENVVWQSYANTSSLRPGVSYNAMRIGAADQQLLVQTGDNRALSWGYVYTVVETNLGATVNVSTSQNGYGPVHESFVNTNPTTLPPPAPVPEGGAPNQGNSGNGTLSFPMSAVMWAGCVGASTGDGTGDRIRGGAGGCVPNMSARVMFFADEIYTISYYGTPLPPYWRRNILPYGDTIGVPWQSIDVFMSQADQAIAAATTFDSSLTELTSPVSDADGNYSAIVAAAYRQVVAQTALVWHPLRNEAWHIMREGAGPIGTVDVIFPASPLFTVVAPQLMQAQLLPTLAFCSNQTSTPYALPYTMHDLGIWPVANRSGNNQENMPIEESANMMLMIAATTLRTGGDVAWLAQFWPAMRTWATYLINGSGLPFPGYQLTTDDFAGAMSNSTNLALKGIIGIAAWGILLQQSGDDAGAQEAWEVAGEYACVWTQYGWYNASAHGADPSLSHPTREYVGNEDGTLNWAQPYNMMFLRALGFDALLPDQQYYLNQSLAYLWDHQRKPLGVPLMSTAAGSKSDWSSFIAALALTPFNSSRGCVGGASDAYSLGSASSASCGGCDSQLPGPSAYSDWTWSSILSAFAAEANSSENGNHLPFPDYYNATDGSIYMYGRSVVGGVLAPLMVYQQAEAEAAAAQRNEAFSNGVVGRATAASGQQLQGSDTGTLMDGSAPADSAQAAHGHADSVVDYAAHIAPARAAFARGHARASTRAVH